jgi:hypothetical protein
MAVLDKKEMRSTFPCLYEVQLSTQNGSKVARFPIMHKPAHDKAIHASKEQNSSQIERSATAPR